MSTRFLEVSEGKIAYDDLGSGPLVICVPSMGDLRSEYRFLAPRLAAAGFRVVTLDVRGHGESTTAWSDFSVSGIGSDLLALISHLNAGPAIILGTSMAAGAAVWAAAEAPQQVRGMVLIDPFVRGESTWQNRLLFGALFARPWGAAVWQKYYSSLYPTRKPEDFTSYSATLRANLQAPGRLEALQKMIAASKAASEARLPRVSAPALVLMGSKDPDFKQPESEARWLAEQLHCRYTLIDGAGHYPHAEMPEITAPLIIDFLRQIAEATRVA